MKTMCILNFQSEKKHKKLRVPINLQMAILVNNSVLVSPRRNLIAIYFKFSSGEAICFNIQNHVTKFDFQVSRLFVCT